MSAPSPRRNAPRVWPAAVMLALLWHGFWCWALAPGPAPHPKALPWSPRVAYMPVRIDGRAPDTLASDVRALWSPILFSLATPMGFSRPLLTNEVRAHPPMGLPMEPPRFLARPMPAAAPLLQPLRELNTETAAQVNRLPATEPPPASAPAARAAVAPLALEWIGQPTGATPSGLSFPRPDWMGKLDSWSARLYVEFNTRGEPAQVFLEEPSSYERVNRLLVTAAQAWRAERAAGAWRGRVTVRAGATPAEAAP